MLAARQRGWALPADLEITMNRTQIVRPTALGLALLNAAAPKASNPGIARQIVWRAENTSAGVVREPSIVLPPAPDKWDRVAPTASTSSN